MWQNIAMDLKKKPPALGFSQVLIVTCYASGMIWAQAMENKEAPTVAKAYDCFLRHIAPDVPRMCSLDNGGEFAQILKTHSRDTEFKEPPGQSGETESKKPAGQGANTDFQKTPANTPRSNGAGETAVKRWSRLCSKKEVHAARENGISRGFRTSRRRSLLSRSLLFLF